MRNILLSFGLLVFFVGCTTKQDMANFENLIKKGNYQEANALTEARVKSLSSDTNLWVLEGAISKRSMGEYRDSNKLFDRYEEIFKKQNESENILTKSGSTVTATLINDSFLEYKSQYYEMIMVNTYKALNFIALKDYDSARIEFNRAIDRQRRAKEYFEKEIEKERAEIEKKKREQEKKIASNTQNNKNQPQAPSFDLDKNLNNKKLDNILQKRYSNIYNFEPYPNFINPFTTYLAGLFFFLQKDYTKASDLLKEAYAMSKNSSIKSDFRLCELSKRDRSPTTWIIFENGLSVKKVEDRIDIPLILISSKVSYTGIALPRLEDRDIAYPYLDIRNSKNLQLAKSKTFADMDRVITTDFQKEFPFIVTRTLISTILKTYMQYLASRQYGDLGSILGGLYQLATTGADTRMALSFPKEFQVAKLKTPKDRVLIINNENIKVPDSKYVIIYIKSTSPFAKKSIEIFEFK